MSVDQPHSTPPSNRVRRRARRPLDVAIVGMACRFPGARDLFAFWENILAGKDCTRDVPASRWDPAVFFDPDSKANDRVYCRRGGYLDEPIEFDPGRHGIMPLAVEGGEPEQFLVLDAARAALDDAGMTAGPPHGSRVEVVIGRGNYFNRGNLARLQHGRIVAQTLGILRALHPEWTDADLDAARADLKACLPPFEAGTIAGQVTNATAGRVANRLDISGASFVVDAASASSLVAVDLGARALVERRADLAIVGGVYLQPDVDFPMVFCQLGALSRRGEARPFSRSADGTLPGEGVGVVVLKRLSDAERDGDRVYAVVKGLGLASDGRGSSLAAPSARGHARALRRAYRSAGIDPATIELVEGHGLGVPASDRAELRALRAVFPRQGRARRTLGAVSGLIGHAMPAAGMAGLIKTALTLHHRVIPPTPHADDPHPLLSGEDSPVSLNPTLRPWVHGAGAYPRRAGVNAFGFGGISVHAVLEEHPASAEGVTPGCMPRWETEAILLGAPDRSRWIELARALLAWLDAGRNDRVPLKDLAYTLNTSQGEFPFRVGMVVESTEALRERLRWLIERLNDPNCRSIRDAKGTFFWEETLAGPGRVAFLYPGEGSQYTGMLADLCPHFPEIRAGLDTADRVSWERGYERLPSELLFGDPTGEDVDLWSIETAVNVVLSAQWAIHQLLTRLRLRPDAVAGHSSGEFLALLAAGVISNVRGLELRLGELGSVFEGLESAGRVPSATLLAVGADRSRVEQSCQEAGLAVTIAMDNCPHQVVVAVAPVDAEALVARLRGGGMLCEPLPYQRAYHTPEFAGALEPVAAFFGKLPMMKPSVPIYSCAVAGRMGEDVDAIRRLAVEQWVSPVAFRATIEAMHADGIRLFVEVGARGNLTGFVEDTLRGLPHFAIAANVPRRSGLTQLNHLVAALYAQGIALSSDHLYARRRPIRIDLAADYQPPDRGRPLAVGFPEMRLSEPLVERLRSPGPPPVAPPSARYERNGTDAAAVSRDQPSSGNGKVASNGHATTQSLDLESPRRLVEPAPAASRTQPVNRAFDRAASEAQEPPGTAEENLLSYFKTMDAFLETQREVMASYLDSRGHSDTSRITGIPETSGKTLVPRNEPMSPVEGHPPTGPVESDVVEILLEQVSRRTGYPRQMLALDLDMEGDLGIDSIKRVEILGELQARGVVPEGADMERLSRCRTLGQVVQALERSGPSARECQAAPLPFVGDVERHDPGREFVGIRWLDASDDPVALNHTLGGRRISAVDPGRLGLPVVPFTVMAEMLAQAAAVLVPGEVVVGLREVRANRWIPYEDGPVALELRAVRDPERPEQVRVTIKNRGLRGERRAGEDTAVEGVVVFAPQRAEGGAASEFRLEKPDSCRFTAEELYGDQWLFHGQALQALEHVGSVSRGEIEGTLRVLPRRALLPERLWPTLHTDPIVLDAFTHLLGCWGIDKRAGELGDVMFPLLLASLDIFGEDPEEGASIDCRVFVREITRYRVRVDAEFVTPGGRVWVRISGWEDWRFYWPDRYRDVFRSPNTVLLGEPLALTGHGEPGTAQVVAVWLEPPADMGKPVWRDVLEWVQLSPQERAANRARGEAEPALSLRIWGRTAAKDAARRLLLARGESPVYPADLVIEPDSHGRPRLRSLAEPDRADLPAISFAHAEGVAVAIAALDPSARVGIDVEPLRLRPEGFERVALLDHDRDWLDRNTQWGADRDEWLTRLWCAREAVGKAMGRGLAGGPTAIEIVRPDVATGEVALRLGEESALACPDPGRAAIRCYTLRRGDHVWAWTTLERIEP
jgi:acyl transferase domain-containing protein/phosphopantetheinyl transferase